MFFNNSKKYLLKGSILLVLAIFFMGTIWLTSDNHQNDDSNVYVKYMQQYQKKYQKDQSKYRQFVFYQTYDDIVFNNKQLDSNYKEGLNQFSDLTQAQFQQMYLIVTTLAGEKQYLQIAQFQDNLYFDWAYLMPPVKDMQDFDAGYIFSVVSVMEFQVNKKTVLKYRGLNQTYKLQQNWITLSEQQIIDCCDSCLNKKVPKYVYNYILNNYVQIDKLYSYTSSIHNPQPKQCQAKNVTSKYKIKGWYQKSNCKDLSDRLLEGPAVVWVDARKWRNYEGGIFRDCGDTKNHYATVVGRGIGFWKIRNSWGRRWGQQGHIRLKSGNTCGVCSKISYVTTSLVQIQ